MSPEEYDYRLKALSVRVHILEERLGLMDRLLSTSHNASLDAARKCDDLWEEFQAANPKPGAGIP